MPRRKRELEWKLLTVALAARKLQGLADRAWDASLEKPDESTLVRRLEPLRHEKAERLSHHVRGRISEDPLRCAVEEDDVPPAVGGHDRVDRSLGKRSQLLLAL